MAEYLVQDTALSDVADAIRTKSGGSDSLAFPAGFISEIGNISTGGGLQYETGVITCANEGTSIEINHNLNSKKVIGMVVPIAGNTYASVGTNTSAAGYKAYIFIFANTVDAVGGPFTLDLSSYHSDIGSQTVDLSNTTYVPVTGAAVVTPWSTHNSYDASNNIFTANTKQNTVFTVNSVGITSGARTFMKGTFRYYIFKYAD